MVRRKVVGKLRHGRIDGGERGRRLRKWFTLDGHHGFRFDCDHGRRVTFDVKTSQLNNRIFKNLYNRKLTHREEVIAIGECTRRRRGACPLWTFSCSLFRRARGCEARRTLGSPFSRGSARAYFDEAPTRVARRRRSRRRPPPPPRPS